MATYRDVMAYAQISIAQSTEDFNGTYKPSPPPKDGGSRSFYRDPQAPQNAHITVVDFGGEIEKFHISVDFGNKNVAIWYYYQSDKNNLSSRVFCELPGYESSQFWNFYTGPVAGGIDKMALEFFHFARGGVLSWSVYAQDEKKLFKY